MNTVGIVLWRWLGNTDCSLICNNCFIVDFFFFFFLSHVLKINKRPPCSSLSMVYILSRIRTFLVSLRMNWYLHKRFRSSIYIFYLSKTIYHRQKTFFGEKQKQTHCLFSISKRLTKYLPKLSIASRGRPSVLAQARLQRLGASYICSNVDIIIGVADMGPAAAEGDRALALSHPGR